MLSPGTQWCAEIFDSGPELIVGAGHLHNVLKGWIEVEQGGASHHEIDVSSVQHVELRASNDSGWQRSKDEKLR